MPSFGPAAAANVIELRAALLRKVRTFFDERGFLEVETPLLSADTVVDTHLDPVPVALANDPRQPERGRRMWLQTSPEFCMKRLLAAAPRPIYQICKAFRLAEAGALHNPEFTMVEWYRPGDDDTAGRQLLSGLCQHVLNCQAAENVAFGEAFLRHAAINPHTATLDEIKRSALRASSAGGAFAGFNTDDRDAWLDFVFVDRVQPHLGRGRPTILFDYPAKQAALAKIRKNKSGVDVAARFELFIDGIELANGYDELLDANELRRRTRENNRLRVAAGKPPLPEENRLLTAMEAGLPPCSGCALGFDRLVMVAAGAKRIDEVIPFPVDRA